jgi:hypothetical protein
MIEMPGEAYVKATQGSPCDRGLLIAGGLGAILWPVLSTPYYAAYPILAGGAMLRPEEGQAGWAVRFAELGQRPAVVTLEWINAALPLLLWPFFVALYRLLGRRGQRDLSLVATGLGLLGIGLMALSSASNPTLLHALGQAYVGATSEAEGMAVLSVLNGLLRWVGGINRMASLLYAGYVGLASLALLRSRTWRIRGWLGVVGAVLVVPAKLSLGLRVPTNAIWTGLAYGVWPLALGVGLLRTKEQGYGEPGQKSKSRCGFAQEEDYLARRYFI